MRTVRFDGYMFGDRILEGMSFLANLDESDPESIEIENVRIAPESDGSYWRDLNTTKPLRISEASSTRLEWNALSKTKRSN